MNENFPTDDFAETVKDLARFQNQRHQRNYFVVSKSHVSIWSLTALKLFRNGFILWGRSFPLFS